MARGSVHPAVRKMILWNSDLRQAVAIKESAKVLRNDELGIEYKALSSEAHRAQGLNPVLHIADELGEVVGLLQDRALAAVAPAAVAAAPALQVLPGARDRDGGKHGGSYRAAQG